MKVRIKWAVNRATGHGWWHFPKSVWHLSTVVQSMNKRFGPGTHWLEYRHDEPLHIKILGVFFMELKEINELRSRMHLDITAAVQEFEKKTGLLVSDIVILRAPAAICGIHTDVRLPRHI